MPTAYIIEDEEALRNLYAIYFSNSLPEIEIIGSSGNGREAVNECLDLKPDLVIVDIRLPEVSGLEICHVLKRKLPQTKVILSSGAVTDEAIRIALQSKADGLIEKSGGMGELKAAIETVGKGGVYFNEQIYNQVLAFQSRQK